MTDVQLFYYMVEIVETETGKVERTLGPARGRLLEKLEAGVNRNLNHKVFHTRVREATAGEVKR